MHKLGANHGDPALSFDYRQPVKCQSFLQVADQWLVRERSSAEP